MQDERKVIVIGAGAVGSTYAFGLMRTGLADEIVLVDLDRERAEAEALDMNHGLFFAPPVRLRAGDYDDCAGAELVVITAGAAQKPGQSRLELVKTNAAICRDVADQVCRRTRDAILLLVTNPVDVLARVVLEHTDLRPGQVISSGTVLDSARFRFLLSRKLHVDARNVHAYIAGEHGDSEVALWSMCHVSGIPLAECCAQWDDRIEPLDEEAILATVRSSAYHLIESKGATNFGVDLALERITAAILRDENSVLTVSSRVGGHYGIDDVCLSLPSVVNRKGVDRIIPAALPEAERAGLAASAQVLEDTYRQLD
jgi:L-lactate dehydrogenase